MRKIFLFLTAVMLLSLGACQDMLDTDSDQWAFDDELELKNPDDAYFAVAGILTELQKIGDRYVIMGELRGDMMTASEYASVSLKEINDFQISSNNVYSDKRDYYNVINNCNYAIQKMDTSLVIRNEKAMMPAFAQIKAIRAWTYMQLAQIYGKAVYLEKPVLDLETSLAEHPTIDLDALVDVLINELTPYIGIPTPTSEQTPNTFIPIELLLGDLYLYRNQYEQAAIMYNTYMSNAGTDNLAIIADAYISGWENTNYTSAKMDHATSYGSEVISRIYYSTDPKDLHSDLVNLSYSFKAPLLPAQPFIDSMAMAPFYFAQDFQSNITAYTEGDFRGNITSKFGGQYVDAYIYRTVTGSLQTMPLIFKYFNIAMRNSIGSNPDNSLLPSGLTYLVNLPVYRQPHLYLRYAEAVNRAGKPTLAFAVLKHGLTNGNIHDPSIVNPSELTTGSAYMNFLPTDRFNKNTPMAARGRGYGIPKAADYAIPDYTRYVDGTDESGNPIKIPSLDTGDLEAARQDSVNWVELQLLNEMAAETPYEGNRFFDLLRISRRRPNHPEFMAEKVSLKYSNPQAMKAKLMNPDAWYVK